MLKTIDKTKVQNAMRLFEIIKERRRLEKEETQLKDYFKVVVKQHGAILADHVLINVKSMSRTSLDTKALTLDMGESFIWKYQRVTDYEQVDVTVTE